MATQTTAAPLERWPALKGTRVETSGNGLDKGIIWSATTIEELIRPREESGIDQKISPESLYRAKVPSDEDFEIPKVVKIREIIRECMDRLSNALIFEDEVERESEMNLITQSIFELAGFIKINKVFKDAICLIQTAVEAQTKCVYTRPQIVALQKVLSLMKDNIFMDEHTLDECGDILEAADFDINAPLARAELTP